VVEVEVTADFAFRFTPLDEADGSFESIAAVLLTVTKAGPETGIGMGAIAAIRAAVPVPVIIGDSAVVGGGGGGRERFEMCSCDIVIGKEAGGPASGCHIMGNS
jgi:hypothetical protein